MNWEHEVQFIKTAPMNTMASNIGGRTIHSFSKLGIDLITGRQAGGKKDVELSENLLHTQIQHMRWIIIDEIENVSVELLDALNRQLIDSTRTTGNPWAVDARDPRNNVVFGGINVIMLGDLWQIPPVRTISIAENPFQKRSANASRILEMFWTKELLHSVTHRFVLTDSHRCVDPWWKAFLEEARAGQLSENMYNFVHGYPTNVPGSWMPKQVINGEIVQARLICGNATCQDLWLQTWPKMYKDNKTWSEMVSKECIQCSTERSRRCRVVSNSNARQMDLTMAFADALFVHPFNAPKSRVLTLRATNAAAYAKKQLLWVTSIDIPLARDDATRTKESLCNARQNWLFYPENKTAGIPGILPIFEGMRIRFTTTEDASAGACKHAWGTVQGWVLHPDDAKLLHDHKHEPEVVLQHLPEAIFIRIANAHAPTQKHHDDNIFQMRMKTASWDRNPGFNAMVKRMGYPLVPHFAATAHSVTGATMPKAIIDLLDVKTTPRSTMIPTSYVAISRTKTADDILITQAFSPMLFRQGHQTGPWLLHSLNAGTKTVSEVRLEWQKAEERSAQKNSKKIIDTTFSCSICHRKKTALSFRLSTSQTFRPDADHAMLLLQRGAWKTCVQCSKTTDTTSKPFTGKWKGTVLCSKCNKDKDFTQFRNSELESLRTRGQMQLAVCIGCSPERQHFNVDMGRKTFKCGQCNQIKIADSFDMQQFKRHLAAKDLECTDCMDARLKPSCKGGCGAKPEKRLQNAYDWWCDTCKYPPCARCLATERPRHDKYVVWRLPEWICQDCRQLCKGGCGRKSTKQLRNAHGYWCEHCMYPKCSKCGTTPRPADRKYAVWNMTLWICPHCREEKIRNA